MTGLRLALIAFGGIVAGYGAVLLLTRQDTDNVVAAAVWLVAGVVLHDAVLVPVTLAVGALAVRVMPGDWRRPAVVALVVMGPLTLLAVPVLGRFGARPHNPSLLDRPYLLAWLVLVAVTTAVVLVVGSLNRRVGGGVDDGSGPGG